MKTVIAGTRDISLYEVVKYAINLCEIEITEVVSGTARGVDKLGERYAEEHDIPIKYFKPDYVKYASKVAPFKRNEDMGKYGDIAILVWDGKSRGTAHMMKRMKIENKPFILVTVAVDYIRYRDTLVRTYEFMDGTRYVEYADGTYDSNLKEG